MQGAGEVVELDAAEAVAAVGELARVLADCVEGGASVSFMPPFGQREAEAFFRDVAAGVADGKTVLLAAKHNGRIEGTVQLGLDTPPNQPHRGDVKKLLVHRNARKAGLASKLMVELENAARRRGRSLLVLDTVRGGEAERLYTRLGWQRTGVIPDYAYFPDGTLCDTVVFWKKV
ncbi:MAG TPA: GNAT family N-acetyltransferase [Rhizomicrobium sp.]|nr:GNAT family N-acetyltransferase [Rhizomicrobium sp.]